ncbi:MAG: hypothetical protein ACYTDW_03950 [Planctomycetota bacterium]|jgi:hypothetical protein
MSWKVVKFIVLYLVLTVGQTVMAKTMGQTEQTGTTGTVEEEAVKDKASLVRTFHIGNNLTDTVNGWLAVISGVQRPKEK